MIASDQHQSAAAATPERGGLKHPTAVALVGFYVGMILMIAVPSGFVALVGSVASTERIGELAPLGLLILVVPLVLIVVPRSRRFGRYLLLGMVSTALVVAAVGGGVLWVLASRS